MKILVCIAVTPDTTSKISFTADGSALVAEGIQFIINPYDEWYALVKALEIKELHGGSVTVAHVGPSANDALIRKALAIGADDAVRINMTPKSSFETATALSQIGSTYDIIFLGKETIDYQSGEVGPMLAELLNRPFISHANKFEWNGSVAICHREIEGGIESCEVTLPVVVSAAKGLAEQRIPNMKGIMSAKSKPLQVIEPSGQSTSSPYVSFTLAPPKKGVKMISPDRVEDLVSYLHESEKLI
jgi:electron transfer flavoprotein beta subunit